MLLRAFIELAHATKLELDFSYIAVQSLSNNKWNWSSQGDNFFDGKVRFLEDYLEKGHSRLEMLYYRYGTNQVVVDAS